MRSRPPRSHPLALPLSAAGDLMTRRVCTNAPDPPPTPPTPTSSHSSYPPPVRLTVPLDCLKKQSQTITDNTAIISMEIKIALPRR